MPQIEPIAIVGMECVFPGAPNLAAFWRNIVRGKSCLTEVPPDRWDGTGHDLPHVPGGFIDGFTEFDPLAFGITPAEVNEGDPEQFLVLSLIDAALRNMRGASGRRGAQVPSPENTEIVIGRGSYISNGAEHVYLRMEALDQVTELLGRILPDGSTAVTGEIRRRLQAGLGPVTADVVACAMPNLTSGRVANRLNVMGRNYTVDAACASSLIAVDNVVRSLREGRCDLGIAAGVHINQKPAFWMAFQALGALSKTGACRPYSDQGDGLLMGEGIGVVVLKRLSDARRDGDRIYAAIRAVGVSSDGRGAAIMTPRLEGECLAMRRAYAESGVDPRSVALIEGHGTATVVGDSTEIDALHAIFGREGASLALGSVKSMIGHTMPAAGMAGLIKTALAVYHRVLPATCNVERVHPKLVGSRICVNTKSRPWVSPPETARLAGVNAFGFGGINAHAILEEVEDDSAWHSMTPQESELFLASADTPAHLAESLTRWRAASARLGNEDLGDLCFTALAAFSVDHDVRLAIVAKDSADLTAKIERIQNAIANGAPPRIVEASGIYYGASRYSGKLAFLFPGIGFPGLAGGYTERLAELYTHFPEVSRNLDLVDAVTRDDDSPQPFSYEWFPPPMLDAKTIHKIEMDLAWSERSPMGLSMANLASWELLHSLGVDPDILAGFSLGELSSLFASGMVDRRQFDLETLQPLRRMMRSVADTSGTDALWAMVATSAERAEAMLHGVPGNVSVTMDISPSQIFIGGEVTAVRAALAKFKDAGIWGQALPAFPLLMPYLTVHTESAAPFEAKLRDIVNAVPLGPSHYLVYSGTTAAPYPNEPEATRDMMLSAVTQPVKVRETIARLYADGVRIFVQLGAGGKMSANVENTLAGSDYVALSSDVAHRGGLEQLHHLLGHLAMLGRRFDPARLYQYRQPRKLDLEESAAKPKSVRKLSLKPPRLHLPPETAEWVRAQFAAAPQPEAPPEPVEAAPTPVAPRRPAGRPATIAGQSAAMMDRFLEAQRAWEQNETQLLQQFLDTQAATAAAVMRIPAQAAPAMPVAPAPTPAPRHFLGEIQSIVPRQELTSRLVLDLHRHPFLSQHALLNVPEGLKPMEERIVTLPMTFEIEILSEVAEALLPGLDVTACHSIEAKRWISLESASTLEISIRARRIGDGEVEMELFTPGHKDPAFRGRASLAAALPAPPAPMEQNYTRPCPHTPAGFYATGPLFHGPMFQLMRSFTAMSDTHIGARLVASGPQEHLGTPDASLVFEPLLLDALQQIVGYRGWLDGWFLMPVGMKRITRFGPPPHAGEEIRASVVYRRLDGRRVEADYEAYDSAGRLWVRIESLQAWRVLSPKALLEANHRPREGYVAKAWPHAAGCYHVKADSLGGLPPEWIARLYLRAAEWSLYQQRPALDWLLGRIAAKDAVRAWFRDHRNLLLHPLEVELANHPDGAPRVMLPNAPVLAVSIAHIENEAVAIAGEAAGLGIDLAEVKERNSGFAGFAFRADELSRFPSRAQNAWIHRGWCAKEAAAKAVRLGFAALPQFRIVAVDPESGSVTLEFSGCRLIASTWQDGNRTLAIVSQ